MAHNFLVLAAGYATRMGSLTKRRAKPLLEVAGKPMMDWVMDRFLPIPGLQRAAVLSNSKFIGDFQTWASDYRSGNPTARFDVIENGSDSPENKRGAIGDLQFALEAREFLDEDLIVVGGDNLFERSPADFVEFSADKPVVSGSYDVGSVEKVKRFASIETDRDGRIVAFEEKPAAPKGTRAGIALFYFQRAILPMIREYLEAGNNPDQAGHLIAWLRTRIPTYGFPIAGKWFDVGSAEGLAEADRVFANVAARDSGCLPGGSRT